MLTREDYEKIYASLNAVSPANFDCGTVCGEACCACGPDLGLWLMPGEEAMHDPTDSWLKWEAVDPREAGFPPSWKEPVWFVQCDGSRHCKRELRPIQCRTFPLMPIVNERGEVDLILNDMDLPYHCPLIESNARLTPEFVAANLEAWQRLCTDPRIYDYCLQLGTYDDDEK